MEAYCFKCKTKREISNPQAVILKSGVPRLRASVQSVVPKFSA